MIDILNTSVCGGSMNEEADVSAECYDCIILNSDDIEELSAILEVWKYAINSNYTVLCYAMLSYYIFHLLFVKWSDHTSTLAPF
jgi:hypothetical protein